MKYAGNRRRIGRESIQGLMSRPCADYGADVEYKVPIGIAAAKKETRSPAAEKFMGELIKTVKRKS